MDARRRNHRLDALIIHHVSPRYDQPGGFEKILRRRWALAEISTRLLFRQRPCICPTSALPCSAVPCGCGAVIVVLEPDLPELLVAPDRRGAEGAAGGSVADLGAVAAVRGRIVDGSAHAAAGARGRTRWHHRASLGGLRPGAAMTGGTAASCVRMSLPARHLSFAPSVAVDPRGSPPSAMSRQDAPPSFVR